MVAPVAGIRALRKIQIGKETTHGSSATATARLIGTLGLKRDQKYYRPEDLETGRLSSFERSDIVGIQAKLPFEADANYEQLGYLLGMSVLGGVTPTGGASPYTWTYLPTLTAASNPDSFTFEYGDDIQAFKSTFCYAPTIEFTGTLDDALKVKAEIVGQSVVTTTFTNSLSNPATLSPVIFGTATLSIDSSWATLGNTAKNATLIDLSYKVSEGIKPVKYADGNVYFSDRAEAKRHVELNATIAFNSVATGLWTPFIAEPQTLSFVRVLFTGNAISGGFNLLKLDGAFLVDDISELQDRDGQDIVKVKLISCFDVTSSKEWEVILVNSLATLP